MKHHGLENVPVVKKKDSPGLLLKLNLFLKMNTSMQENPRRKKRVSHWRGARLNPEYSTGREDRSYS